MREAGVGKGDVDQVQEPERFHAGDVCQAGIAHARAVNAEQLQAREGRQRGETGVGHVGLGQVEDFQLLRRREVRRAGVADRSAELKPRQCGERRHDLQRVVEELKTRTPKKVKLALLIDEVDVLNEYSERINQRLRSIFMKTFSEHLVAIMSGVGIKRIWKSEGSPWYNFFDEIELTAFTREEAEELIRRPVEDVFRWQPEAVERILEQSALKPYVIQKYCIHAVNRMLEHGRTTIRLEDVEAVRDEVQFEAREPPAPARRNAAQQASA